MGKKKRATDFRISGENWRRRSHVFLIKMQEPITACGLFAAQMELVLNKSEAKEEKRLHSFRFQPAEKRV